MRSFVRFESGPRRPLNSSGWNKLRVHHGRLDPTFARLSRKRSPRPRSQTRAETPTLPSRRRDPTSYIRARSGPIGRQRSRSLSESTRQITPPTKNGHAPPFGESRKSFQSVNPHSVLTRQRFPCWVKLSRILHAWWCHSVNSFKFQPCDGTSP